MSSTVEDAEPADAQRRDRQHAPAAILAPERVEERDHAGMEERDLAEVIVACWLASHHGADATTKLLALRLRRVAHHLERALRQELAGADIDPWEMELLLSLRRAPSHRASAGELLREAQVTSGAITNRVARLESRGWVRRDVDPGDRRHVLVTLTAEGERRAEEVAALKTEADQRVLAPLDPGAQRRMAAELKRLLLAIEGPAGRDAAGLPCGGGGRLADQPAEPEPAGTS